MAPVAEGQPPKKADVAAADFFALDLRVGRVAAVEPFPEARKPAWKLTVDFGPEVGTLRTSAQVTSYTQEELTGRLVVGAVNLGSKRIAGFKSEFLVLGSLDPDGRVRLLQPEPGAEPGHPVA
jgi:tRNA-binding protein